MPATPLHCIVAYVINRWRQRLSLPGLLVSSMVSDLEIPIIFLMTGGLQDRLVLHSLLGAGILGMLLSVLLTVFFYPPAVSFFFKLDRKRVEKKCRLSSILILSCVIGGLSHVFLDSMTHEFNPVFYPIVKESFDTFVFTNDLALARAIVRYVLIVLLIFFFVDEMRRGTRDFWMRTLVG
jgi:membrane-bound metal-dependent hydrolase YbcI (DUF457 family)